MKRQQPIQNFFFPLKTSKQDQNAEPCDTSSTASEGASISTEDSEPTTEEHTQSMGHSKCSSVTKFPFIEVAKEGYWCKTCKSAYNQGKLLVDGKTGGAWIVKPISKSNASKLGEKAAKHGSSGLHRHAESILIQSQTISEAINEAAKSADDQTKFMRKNMAVASYFLFKQEVAHTTNWRSLLSTFSIVNPQIEHWFKGRPANAHYLSARNSTDWLEACGATVRTLTLEKVQTSISTFKKFSYMADECTDINGRQILSHCIRYLDVNGQPTDAFLDVEVIHDASASSVTTHILNKLSTSGLDSSKMASCSFDGAANFSGRHGGVQALLKQKCNPHLCYTHCRGHLLQLALVRAAESSKETKRAINLVSSLYSFFSKSPKRLGVLEKIENALELKLKLVKPGKTRWLSHERSLAVILNVLEPLILALESIYEDGADMSSEAGGLLLQLRSEKTIAVLTLVDRFLRPLASLNNAIQAATTTAVDLCPVIEATTEAIAEISVEAVLKEVRTSAEKLLENGTFIELLREENESNLTRQLTHYKDLILDNLRQRLVDPTRTLRSFYVCLSQKRESVNWREVLPAVGLPYDEEYGRNLDAEWNIFRRLNEDLTSTAFLSSLLVVPHLVAMFPRLQDVVGHLLLLPITTATVERSFSALNRVLSSERSRLLPNHVNELLSITIEGPEVPDARDATDDDRRAFMDFIAKVVRWYSSKKPRRM